jgi:hypothetical protein
MNRQFLSFFVFSALFLTAAANSAFGQAVMRGPYLQSGTPSSIVVRWRTDGAVGSDLPHARVLLQSVLEPSLVFGYGSLSERQISRGISQLAASLV